jgi:hypothetical protein
VLEKKQNIGEIKMKKDERLLELLEAFKSYKGMIVNIHELSNKYLTEEEPLSLEDQLMFDMMLNELGWDDKEDFLNGVGMQKVITINVPKEEEYKYKITIEFTDVNWLHSKCIDELKNLDTEKYREWIFEE